EEESAGPGVERAVYRERPRARGERGAERNLDDRVALLSRPALGPVTAHPRGADPVRRRAYQGRRQSRRPRESRARVRGLQAHCARAAGTDQARVSSRVGGRGALKNARCTDAAHKTQRRQALQPARSGARVLRAMGASPATNYAGVEINSASMSTRAANSS